MKKRKILTLNDLYSYYDSKGKDVQFSSSDEDTELVVQIPANLKFNDNSKDGLLPVVLQTAHIGKNINRSSITEEAAKNALLSFHNRPILAYIHYVDDEPQFYTHTRHEGENGEIVYDEFPVGVIPESCDARIEYDKGKDKSYIVVNGYIYEEYSKAAEILKREETCSVSVELSLREASYNAKTKLLEINDFYFNGVTILGVDEDGNKINPGMTGANITIADFSKENNSMFSENKLSEMSSKLDKILSHFDINNSKEGGKQSLNKFEELLEKYRKSADEITFDYKNLSDEDLEKAFSEAFDVSSSDNTNSSDTNINDNDIHQKYSVVFPNGNKKEFELNLNDINSTLSNLVNETFRDDECWYDVLVYMESGYLIMQNYFAHKYYRQNFEKDGDTYTLIGERVPVHQIWVTDEEETGFNSMKENYPKMEIRIQSYERAECDAKKNEIFSSKEYEKIAGTEEAKALISDKETFSSYSVEEFSAKLDEIMLSYAKAGKIEFNAEPNQNTVPKKGLPLNTPKKNGRYGGIFRN